MSTSTSESRQRVEDETHSAALQLLGFHRPTHDSAGFRVHFTCNSTGYYASENGCVQIGEEYNKIKKKKQTARPKLFWPCNLNHIPFLVRPNPYFLTWILACIRSGLTHGILQCDE